MDEQQEPRGTEPGGTAPGGSEARGGEARSSEAHGSEVSRTEPSAYERKRRARRAHPPQPEGQGGATGTGTNSTGNNGGAGKNKKSRGSGSGHKLSEEERTSRRRWRVISGIVIAALLAFIGTNQFMAMQWSNISTSEGIALLEGTTVQRVQITDGTNRVRLWLTEPTKTMDGDGDKHDAGKKVTFQYADPQGQHITTLVERANPERGHNSIVPSQNVFVSMLFTFLPMILIFAVFIWFMRSQMGRGFGAKDANADGEVSEVRFSDVAGEDEAVEEVKEVVDFLKNPDRYQALGARIPRGVLLYGPPGTGKTLLAKAIAGEAQVPFFSIAASEFVELYVGMGASRVRELFKTAKKKAPAIIFVDEIDAVGRGRGSGALSHGEQEQTLNQLLVEMDGFSTDEAVVLIAATNRPDVLDPALLRPGRFDRQVAVDAPDIRGREAILRVHARGKPLADDVDLAGVAKRTPGFTGADLANILNEAALLAARRHAHVITNADVDEASDRVMAGPQRSSRVMSPEDRRMTAYHEGGHALAAAALRYTDPVTKVTILPRGRALGYTMVMPTEDRYSVTRNQLLDQLTYALGGRAAEEIIFRDPSTGASNDIQKATETARKIVTEYGMTTAVGAVRVAPTAKEEASFAAASRTSDSLAATVDENVRALLDQALTEAWTIITENRDILDHLAEVLLDKETVLENELAEIFKDVVKAPEREVWLSAPDRPVSQRPPIPLPEGKTEEEAAADSRLPAPELPDAATGPLGPRGRHGAEHGDA